MAPAMTAAAVAAVRMTRNPTAASWWPSAVPTIRRAMTAVAVVAAPTIPPVTTGVAVAAAAAAERLARAALWLLRAALLVPLATQAQPEGLGEPPVALSSRVGLPQIARTASGEHLPWRALSLQAEAGDWRFTARLPTCLATAPVTPAAAHGGCGGTAGRHALARELQAGWLAVDTALGPLGLGAELSMLAWQVPGRPTASAANAEAWLDARPAVGALRWAAGVSLPVRALRWDDDWAVAFTSLRWGFAPRQTLTLTVEHARSSDGEALDRSVALRYQLGRSTGNRWQATLARHPDDPARAWTASVGADWRF